MSIDINDPRHGFSLCIPQPRKPGDIWSRVEGGSEPKMFDSIKTLYAPDGDAAKDDLPFVEMNGPSCIKY